MSASENQKPTQADVLREIFNAKIEESFDWSNQQKCRQLKEEILAKHSDLFNKKTLNSNFSTILNQCLVRAKKDPREYGRKSKAPRFNLGESDMHTNIKLETLPTETTDAQKMEAAKSASPQTGSTTPDAPRPWTDGLDAESVSASLSALYLSLKIGFPELDALTDEEKKSLGKLWLPAFKKYLTEMQAIVIIPLLATLGIFGPKIAKARKAAKEKKQEKKPEEKTE